MKLKNLFYVVACSFILIIPNSGCDSPTNSKKRIGAVCKDGTTTSATGSGACSHHGGVDHWIYED